MNKYAFCCADVGNRLFWIPLSIYILFGYHVKIGRTPCRLFLFPLPSVFLCCDVSV